MSTEERSENASCWRRRWKQLLAAGILTGIITWVIVDAITKNCVSVEPEGERVQRLYCDDLLNVTESGDVIPGQPFQCGDGKDGYHVDTSVDPVACSKLASCLSVGFDAVLVWISENPGLGWLVVVVVYSVLTIALIPGSVLTIGSGVAFGSALGLWKGVAVASTAVLTGALIGCFAAFLLGRFLLREHVEHWGAKFPTVKALDRALQEKGFQVVLLLRLSPIVPYNIFNFLMGSTSVSSRNYFMGSLLGMPIGTFAYTLLGALVGAAAFDNRISDSDGSKVLVDGCEEDPKQKTIRLVVLIAGIIATIAAALLVSFYARKQFLNLKKSVDEEDEHNNTNHS